VVGYGMLQAFNFGIQGNKKNSKYNGMLLAL